MELETRPKPCVGSGLCCWKGPCGVAAEKYNDLGPWLRGEGCPSLRWDGKRYWCKEVEARPELKEELYIGDGCCMSLFNDNRERILHGIGRPWTPKDKEME
jgi:hypothetical protein